MKLFVGVVAILESFLLKFDLAIILKKDPSICVRMSG